MVGGHKPRSGSLAYYPRVRAKKQLATFNTYPANTTEEAKALTFFGYKAGMTQIFGKNSHEKSTNFGQETCIPSTVIECPPIRIIGARLYSKTNEGLKVLGEATIEKPGKNLRKKIVAFKKHGKKKKDEKQYSTFEDITKLKKDAIKVVLLAELQPSHTGIGKKKANVSEIELSGNVESQLVFAKEKFGKELKIHEVFDNNTFIDVKAVNKGRGFQGPVKRFGIKIQRPKAKKHRAVGSISPWHPATVMWTVPRPGQMGYHTRTEYNKRILFMEGNPETVNPKRGFLNYGVVKNEFIVLSGSVPGPAKREIALRPAIRKIADTHAKFTDLTLPFEAKVKEAKADKVEKKEEVTAKAEVKEEEKTEATPKKEAPVKAKEKIEAKE